jgi:hypothetical protein
LKYPSALRAGLLSITAGFFLGPLGSAVGAMALASMFPLELFPACPADSFFVPAWALLVTPIVCLAHAAAKPLLLAACRSRRLECLPALRTGLFLRFYLYRPLWLL